MMSLEFIYIIFFFFQAEDGIRDYKVTGVQTCALPICHYAGLRTPGHQRPVRPGEGTNRIPHWPAGYGGRTASHSRARSARAGRSGEHTPELQSPCNIVCRLLLVKKKNVDQSPLHTSTS